MARDKKAKTKKLTKDLKVSEETVKKVKGGLNPQPEPPLIKRIPTFTGKMGPI